MRRIVFDKVGKGVTSVKDATDFCTAGTSQGMRGAFVERMKTLGGSGKWESTHLGPNDLIFHRDFHRDCSFHGIYLLYRTVHFLIISSRIHR